MIRQARPILLPGCPLYRPGEVAKAHTFNKKKNLGLSDARERIRPYRSHAAQLSQNAHFLRANRLLTIPETEGIRGLK